MKKIYFCFVLFCLTFISYSQGYVEVSPDKWSVMNNEGTASAAFDGKSVSAFIVGTSDFSGTPILSVNKTGNFPIQVFLSYFPAPTGRNGDATVIFKFNNGLTHTFATQYSLTYERYIVTFTNDFTIEEFIVNVKTQKMLYMRFMNKNLLFDIEFNLNGAAEALKSVM